MDNYESVVMDYLRADRAIFVNTEFCIQVNKGPTLTTAADTGTVTRSP